MLPKSLDLDAEFIDKIFIILSLRKYAKHLSLIGFPEHLYKHYATFHQILYDLISHYYTYLWGKDKYRYNNDIEMLRAYVIAYDEMRKQFDESVFNAFWQWLYGFEYEYVNYQRDAGRVFGIIFSQLAVDNPKKQPLPSIPQDKWKQIELMFDSLAEKIDTFKDSENYFYVDEELPFDDINDVNLVQIINMPIKSNFIDFFEFYQTFLFVGEIANLLNEEELQVFISWIKQTPIYMRSMEGEKKIKLREVNLQNMFKPKQ